MLNLNNIKKQAFRKNKEKFMSILNDVRYFKEFNDHVRVSFAPDESVRKNYQVNYGLRLTDE